MNVKLSGRLVRQALAAALLSTAPFLYSCSNQVVDPAPTTGTTGPGSGTVTTPGTGTTTTPGTGTTTTPGTGTSTTPGTGTSTTPGTVFPTATYVSQQANLNFLEAAIARAGLTDEVNKGGLTLFAPSDEAFRAAGYASEAAVSAAPVADLQRILRYHIVGSVIDLPAFPTAVNTSYQTALANARLTVYKASASDISVNSAKITQGNNPTVSSVVHIINRVLMPPTANATDVAKANANLTFLAVAAERAGTSIQTILSGDSQNGVTIFAPTNDAFKAAGFADEAAIRAADPKRLADILSYHVLNYRAFAQTFQNGADVATANGATVRFNVNNGKVTILGKGNGNNVANIVTPDQVASNGVIHVIDRLLLPTNP
ncbi:fasciclin domain-containing protein [Rudanella paleaurantiibacter]|uniref:Fasciclin domain-containing protein n=1 Tax=Rudanella paleaurantiibacter TaxID=2614655 RepID=A0A7J5TYZ2_9BACT|nr:fasciclin domain-containing protein [Rudanella paleaurantiibacter]KAB7730368.1 fasciclin domain-containing protein [Rudanella paleaurantiibacter]